MKKITIVILGCLISFLVNAQSIDTILLKIDGVSIHSVLTQPMAKGNIPLAVFIAGSGPTDLNGNQPMMKNNNLKLLSEALVNKNLATLRFDKRGVAKSADPNFAESQMTIDRYANDVVALINQMKTKGFKDIYIIGHSEGSLLGLIALQKINVKGFISVAGAGFPADEIIKKQLKPQLPPDYFSLVTGIIDSLKNDQRVINVPEQMNALFRPSVQPYLISWFNYSPTELISKIACPILIVQGDKDIQVTTEDAQLLSKAAKNDKLIIIKNMNHIFKTISGDVQENYASYTNPDLPVDQELSKVIADFILSQRK